MKTIIRPHLFKRNKRPVKDPVSLSDFSDWTWMSAATAHTCVSVVLLVLTVYKPVHIVLFLTFVIPRLLLYSYLLELAKGLQVVNFTCSSHVPEGAEASLQWTLKNTALYHLRNYQLQVRFPANSASADFYFESQLLESSRMRHFAKKLKCDVGMGTFDVGPMSLFFSDAFGIYNFEVNFEFDKMITVLPNVISTSFFQAQPSAHSEMYGSHELRSRGLSVNFSGLRNYHYGDSIRHIAWRKTARLGTLIVKEFEKVVNADVCLILNLNPVNHLGTYEVSTWNSARDLALTVTAQLIEEGNSVSFGYNRGFIERGYGADQLALISKALIQYDIYRETKRAPDDLHFEGDPLSRFAPLLTVGATVVFIDTLIFSTLSRHRVLLKSLLVRGLGLELFLIKPNIGTANPHYFFESGNANEGKSDKMRDLLSELQMLGAKIFVIDLGRPIAMHVHLLQHKPQMVGGRSFEHD